MRFSSGGAGVVWPAGLLVGEGGRASWSDGSCSKWASRTAAARQRRVRQERRQMRSSITLLRFCCAAWRGLCTHPSGLDGAMREQLAQTECGRETTPVHSAADSAESGGVVDACEGLWRRYHTEVRPATSRCCGDRADGRRRVSLVRLARSGIGQQSTLPSREKRSGGEGLQCGGAG